MCGDGPAPVYQGKTYRREKVSLNDKTLDQYGGAWKGGKNNNGTLSNSVQAGKTLATNPNYGNGPSILGRSNQESAFVDASTVKRPTTTPGSLASYSAANQFKTFDVNSRLDPGIYGADDGSFLTSQSVSRNTAPMGASLSSYSIQNQTPNQYETYRYVEDAIGQFGVEGFSDNGVPTKFKNLSSYDIQSTSNKKDMKLSDVAEPKDAAPPKDRRKRQKGSVSTSSFRIELGTPTKTSGLRVPI